jgi:hypothetical protein
MENNLIKISILNVTGKLGTELEDYFLSRQIVVSEPNDDQQEENWTHILVNHQTDIDFVVEKYKVYENNTTLVSLSELEDPKKFLLSNGRLVIQESWLKSSFSYFILDKFFQDHIGTNNQETYPSFQQLGSFNISNPFSTGDYLDRLVYKALKDDFPALSIKTYFDHFLMYAVGLKNKGKLGLPIEVTYGSVDTFFGVQIHFFADGLNQQDIASALSKEIGPKSEESLLNIALQSVDFFDCTFLQQVKKVVVSGIWIKNAEYRNKWSGMMFSSLSKADSIQQLPLTESLDIDLDNSQIEDLSYKMSSPGGEAEDKVIVSGSEISEALTTKIVPHLDLEKIKEILTDNSVSNEEELINIPNAKDLEEVVQIVHGKVEEDVSNIRVRGAKLDVDDFVTRISAGLAEKTDDNIRVKSLGNRLPDAIKRGLYDFAIGIGKDVDRWNDSDLQKFRVKRIPQIIKEESSFLTLGSKKLKSQFKDQLEKDIKEEFSVDSIDEIINDIESPDKAIRVKQLASKAIKNSFEKDLHLSTKPSVSEFETDLLVEVLGNVVNDEKQQIKHLMNIPDQDRVNDNVVVQSSKSNEKILENKLKTSEREIKSLKNKIQTMGDEISMLRKSSLSSMVSKAAPPIKEELQDASIERKVHQKEEALRRKLQDSLAPDKIINSQTQAQISHFLEMQAKLLELTRNKELEARRLQTEFLQKEAILVQELEKANRNLKNKDLVVTKTKDALHSVIDKKDADYRALEERYNKLNGSLSSTLNENKQISSLEKKNQNMSKIIEMYREKLANFTNKADTTKNEDNSTRQDNRRLEIQHTQLKRELDLNRKELEEYQQKAVQDLSLISNLKNEKTKLLQQVKTLTLQLKLKENSVQNTGSDPELKKMHNQNQVLESRVKDLAGKLKEAEKRLFEAMRGSQKQTSSDDGNKRVAQLEVNLKKLSQDLLESRSQAAELKKEANKLRLEKTSMQNQLDKHKKDSEKSGKGASIRKPDGGGKAA